MSPCAPARPVHAFERRQGAAREPQGAVVRGQAEIAAEHLCEQRQLGVGIGGAAALDGDQTRLDPVQFPVQ